MPLIVAAPVFKLYGDGVSPTPLVAFTKGIWELNLNSLYSDAQVLGNFAEEEDDAVLIDGSVNQARKFIGGPTKGKGSGFLTAGFANSVGTGDFRNLNLYFLRGSRTSVSTMSAICALCFL